MSRGLTVLNALSTVAALGLAAACAGSVLQNPFGGMRAPAYLVIWGLACLGLNRGCALLEDLAPPGSARRWLRIAKWFLPWLPPVVAIQAVERAVLARQIDIASRDLAPVIAFAEAQSRKHEGTAAEEPPPVRFPVAVRYQLSERRFVLWLTAPSIDIDGYTLTYDSRSRRWQRRHNDMPGAVPEEASSCILRAGKWRCEADADRR